MYLLRIDFSSTDIAAFLIMAVVLGLVVQFVLVSRRKLHAMIEESKMRASLTGCGGRYFDEDLKPNLTEKKKIFPSFVAASAPRLYKTAAQSEIAAGGTVLDDLKHTMRQQQKVVDQLLTRMDKLDAQDRKGLAQTAMTAMALEEQETELQKTKQQLSIAQKVAGRVTEVYEEFDLMQQKMAELEESAAKVTGLELELNDMQGAYAQLKKEAARNGEKFTEAQNEKEQLQQQLAQTEEQLAQAERRQLQLQKRMQLLEDMNAEMHHMSDANKKLKGELRRIAELESMLSLVSDERDLLLKKRLA